MKTELPVIYSIKKIIHEADGIYSIILSGKYDIKPGQFVMVWLPNVDEKPMAVSYLDSHSFGFTYHKIGKFTTALSKLTVGDKVGIRGPYGKAFSLRDSSVVVGGGVGLASVALLIDALKKPIVLHGARSSNHLIYQKRFDMNICTDDGSAGHHGFVTDLLEDVLKNKKVKVVYTCGPEIMMKKVLDLCNFHKIDCEAALERYMKCGFGICGNCLVDDKILCTEGPIFNRSTLNSLSEFGTCARLKTGKKAALAEYYGK